MFKLDEAFFEDLLDLLGDIYISQGRTEFYDLLREHDDVRNNLVAYFVTKDIKNEKHL